MSSFDNNNIISLSEVTSLGAAPSEVNMNNKNMKKITVVLISINLIDSDSEKYIDVYYKFIRENETLFIPKECKRIIFGNNVTSEYLNQYKEFIENIVIDDSIYFFLLALYDLPIKKNNYLEILGFDDIMYYFHFKSNIKSLSLVYDSVEAASEGGDRFIGAGGDSLGSVCDTVMTVGIKNKIFSEPKISYNYINSPIEKIWSFMYE